ncbi:MAG: TonB family protein [Sphingobium sp.]|uniref:energy transducer TonB n=1 Tax=Sphingobium sp. TaxID=1912891 RepID=UPI0029B92BC4|nr:TonB family protein [Sphingobium sp.]MDX3911621.1 TonB family protein [Sphingobium sp.]
MIMLRHEVTDFHSSVAHPPMERPASLAAERYGYAAPAGSRIKALIGTGAIYAVVLGGFLITFNRATPVHAPSAPLVVELLPLASPPEAPPEQKEAPRPVEEQKEQPEPSKVPPIERTVVPITPIAAPVPVILSNPANPGPVEPETAAPKTVTAPLAQTASSDMADTWEGKVLAQLNKYRRYPRAAMVRRQQGVPYIRFVMDREGRVLSSRLERSSGFPELDREAVALPRRASPFPKPPVDKPGDTLELVFP